MSVSGNRELSAAVVRVRVDRGEAAAQLPEERRDRAAEGRRVQHLAEAVHLEHDHPEPRERLVGGGEDVAVLRALDVHLEQQVAVGIVVADPVLEADVVLARARVEPLLEERLHPGFSGVLNSSTSHEKSHMWDSMP